MLFFFAYLSFFLILKRALSKQYYVNTPTSFIKFSGGGIYFWWQAGVCKYLLEKGFNSKSPTLGAVIGTSAGSLAATLLVTSSDLDKAAEIAVAQAQRENLWDNPTGLYGIWGPLVREWLQNILPDDCNTSSLSSLYLGVTPIAFKHTQLLSGFSSKDDVINACLASCHIPFFLDNKPFARYKGTPYIDGSFWQFLSLGRFPEPFPTLPCDRNEIDDVYVIDWTKDVEMHSSVQGVSFVSLIKPEFLYDLMDFGYNFIEREHRDGRLPKGILYG